MIRRLSLPLEANQVIVKVLQMRETSRNVLGDLRNEFVEEIEAVSLCLDEQVQEVKPLLKPPPRHEVEKHDIEEHGQVAVQYWNEALK